MAKRSNRKPQGHPARIAEAAAAKVAAEAVSRSRSAHRALDELVTRARALGDPSGIEAAEGIRDEMLRLEAGGHVRLAAHGGRFSAAPLDAIGREALAS